MVSQPRSRRPFWRQSEIVMGEKMLAVIREAECVGCTKCIDACPVDAILGSAKLMHTVIAEECIGCKLCIPPCPVDCIDLIPFPESQSRMPAKQIKLRHQARQKRQQTEKKNASPPLISLAERKTYLEAVIARAKAKK
jgi:electron transport complex protein RnfB